MKLESFLRIAGVLIAVGVVAGLATYYQRYVTAREQVEQLEEQRDGLVNAAREMALREARMRQAGDTIGTASEAANTGTQASVAAIDEQANEARDDATRDAEPEQVASVLRLDSLRVAQLDSMQVIHERDSVTIVQLRRQLVDERAIHDMAMANAQEQIRNLELQRDLFQDVAQTGWIDKLKGGADIAGIAFAAGIAFDRFVLPKITGP